MNRTWRKSARCSANNGCVELRSTARQVHVRDSKDPYGSPVLEFDRDVFAAFVRTVKADR